MKREKFFTAKRLSGLAILTALIVALQIWGGYIRIGATNLSFVLVPIVIGSILYGALSGMFLGFVFGVITLLYGITGADFFTSVLFNDHPFFTALLCIVKGAAAGLVPGLIYSIFQNKLPLLGVFLASASAPIVNTGLFIVGSLCFLTDTLSANFVQSGSVVYFLIIGCAGMNFLVEFAINLVCSPAVHTAIRVIEKTSR